MRINELASVFINHNISFSHENKGLYVTREELLKLDGYLASDIPNDYNIVINGEVATIFEKHGFQRREEYERTRTY